jgi:hypothetical protein
MSKDGEQVSGACIILRATGAEIGTSSLEVAQLFDITVLVSDLPNTSSNSIVSPMVALYCQSPDTGEFQYIAQTERIANESTCEFKDHLSITRSNTEGKHLMLSLYNVGESNEITEQDSIGTCLITLNDIINNGNNPLVLRIAKGTEVLEYARLTLKTKGQ